MTTNAKRIINDAIEAWHAPEDASFGRVAVDALMAGHDDVHLHRHPDGTVSVTPMRNQGLLGPGTFVLELDDIPEEMRHLGTPVWVDVEAGAS